MLLICPECKNEVDPVLYANVAEGTIVECNHCGISLMVSKIQDGNIETTIVDEGK
ncbi:MAG: hypothetical protein ABI430_00055 [Candidatus Taylorbacteria bacterium]